MWQIIILKNKNKKLSDQGFITLEILISLFIATAFLMVSLQTLVAAMAFKVIAQEEQRADKLIQDEVERLNDLGSTLNFGANTADACNGVLDIDGVAGTTDDGYGQGLWNLRTKSNAMTAATTNSDSFGTVTVAGKTITLTGTQVSIPASASPTPHRVLGIAYVVTKPDEDGDNQPDVIANRYVEVIPDAALECP